MPSGWDFGRFPTIFDDVSDDMRRASDMRHMENLTHPLDSASPKVMETNPKRVEPDRYHTQLNVQMVTLDASTVDPSDPSYRYMYRPSDIEIDPCGIQFP